MLLFELVTYNCFNKDKNGFISKKNFISFIEDSWIAAFTKL